MKAPRWEQIGCFEEGDRRPMRPMWPRLNEKTEVEGSDVGDTSCSQGLRCWAESDATSKQE